MGGNAPPPPAYQADVQIFYTTRRLVAGEGIEPSLRTYEARQSTNPSHPASIYMVGMRGIEPLSSPCQGAVLPLNYTPELGCYRKLRTKRIFFRKSHNDTIVEISITMIQDIAIVLPPYHVYFGLK